MRISENFAAGVPKKFDVSGDFFRIETAAGPVDVDFYRRGQALPENLRVASAGYWAAPEGGFDSLTITAAGAHLVEVDVYRGRVGADRVAGSVQVSNFPAAGGAVVSDGAVTVANTSGIIVAANAARRYLLVQNNHATGRVYLRFGAAATVAAGIRLEPGQKLELSGYQFTAALHAIGDVLSNADVVVLEG